jgi:hypothetical protein
VGKPKPLIKEFLTLFFFLLHVIFTYFKLPNFEMLQADFGTGSIPQSPGGASAVPSSPGASQSAYSPKGGHSQGSFKPPIMGISPPPTSSAKKAAQR